MGHQEKDGEGREREGIDRKRITVCDEQSRLNRAQLNPIYLSLEDFYDKCLFFFKSIGGNVGYSSSKTQIYCKTCETDGGKLCIGCWVKQIINDLKSLFKCSANVAMNLTSTKVAEHFLMH